MKIAVAGGNAQAFYLVGVLLSEKHEVEAVCAYRREAQHMAEGYDIPVICGNPTNQSVLEDLDMRGFDVMIALTDCDVDNLVICQTAQRLFGVRRRVCTVHNPRNVELFGQLGVSVVISGAYLVAQAIIQASTVESLDKAFDELSD